MVKVLQTKSIDVAQEEVFRVAQDYDLRLEWDPFLEDIKFVSDYTTLQRGLQVWVKSYNGMEMTVQYLNYQKPNHVSMKMLDGPWMFDEFSGLWKFEPDESSTLVTFKYEFRLKWYLRPGNYIVKWILQRDMRKRLDGLASWFEEN